VKSTEMYIQRASYTEITEHFAPIAQQNSRPSEAISFTNSRPIKRPWSTVYQYIANTKTAVAVNS